MKAHYPTIRAVVIEDEPGPRELLLKLIQLDHPSVEVVGTASDVRSGVELVRSKGPDMVFLDVGLDNEEGGFDLLDELGAQVPYIVITTASRDHAVKAFRFSVSDYLLKPIDPRDLASALNKIAERVKQEREIEYHNRMLFNVDRMGRLRLPARNGFLLVPLRDIAFCRGDGNYSYVVMEDGKEHHVTRTIGQLEADIKEGFMRVHKSHLVNLSKIYAFINEDGGMVVMRVKDRKNDAEVEVKIRVSRDKRQDLMNALELN